MLDSNDVDPVGCQTATPTVKIELKETPSTGDKDCGKEYAGRTVGTVILCHTNDRPWETGYENPGC